MLYTLIGTDIEKVRARGHALVEALKEKRPDASSFRLHLENWSNDKFKELTGSIGLFSSKYIIFLDNLLTGLPEKKYEEKENPAEIILENLKELKGSDHVWIIVEDALFGKSSGKDIGVRAGKDLDKIIDELKKHSDKIEEHDVRKAATTKKGWGSGEVNSFTFTDAFFDKDKVRALNALTALEDMETAAEEIHGALWWQTKVMFQILKNDTKGLSPFVVGKSQKFLKKWGEKDLKVLSDAMVENYHQGHLGKVEIGDGLAKMVLKL